MRVASLLLSGLLLADLAACNGFGGSEGSVGGSPDNFTILSRSPNGSALGVPVTASIVVSFSSTIDQASVTPGVLTLNDASFGAFTVEGVKLTFTPSSELNPGSSYTVVLSPGIKGINGVQLGAISSWTFKTAGTPPPPPDTGAASPPRPR